MESLLYLTTALVLAASPARRAGCDQLTPAKFDLAINHTTAGLAKAETDVIANGETGAYAIAAVYNRDYLKTAVDQVKNMKNWLQNESMLVGGYVTNASAAYSVHQTAREATCQLQHARHWATISTVYHRSKAARDSMTDTTSAVAAVEDLGSNASVCYVSGYIGY